MAKIVSVSPLAADPMKNKLILEDGTVVHVRKDGPVYEVGEDYEPPLEQQDSGTNTGLSGFAEGANGTDENE